MNIVFYEDSMYESLVRLLQDNKLYDEVWEARENLQRKITRDPQSILVALDDTVLVGCVFIMEDGWNGFVWRLCVAKDYRKQGIGSLLMQRAESILKERGLKEVCLLVDPPNTELKSWYQKRDYIQASDRTFMYKKLN